MCWFIRGALQGNIDPGALDVINAKHSCHISQGTKHDVKMAVLSDRADSPDGYRVTDGCCDCESDIGRNDPESAEVADLAGLIAEAGALQGSQNIFICKSWIQKRNKNEKKLKLSEIDLKQFLADFESSTLYCISCNA